MSKANKIFTCFISCYSHDQLLHTGFCCSSTRAQHELFQTTKHVQDYKQEHWHHNDLTCLPLSLTCSITGTAHWNCSPKNSFSSKPAFFFFSLFHIAIILALFFFPELFIKLQKALTTKQAVKRDLKIHSTDWQKLKRASSIHEWIQMIRSWLDRK